ncbi:alpha/beta hydrolase [Ornithinibacillus halotolerans]|uniref:Carboxylesterase n=1 Tax=Ornithinibacillus halotolerans TaxID=1274357 RepID=A0A916S249_9BACI|nr:alpha/beta fold hydrolase [Ornithinibacillus halotolerans]GGA80101.1 carboxylesterase [Ornithinibacillus halotolerans]
MEKYPVMKEAEEFYFEGNEIGVLISHGFTGTTQSMRYIGERIAKSGYTVYGPRLTGHGTHPEDMERASYKDWIATVEGALEKLKETCSTIFVVGLSMGGTLALYLAENHPNIAGIMPINAAINMSEFATYYQGLKEEGARFVPGIGSDIKKEGIKELAYEQTPVKSMGDLLTLMNMVRENLTKITVPTLVLSSTVDHVVPPENSQEIYKNISSEEKRMVTLENSYHVATLDNDKELIAKECVAFIEKYS